MVAATPHCPEGVFEVPEAALAFPALSRGGRPSQTAAAPLQCGLRCLLLLVVRLCLEVSLLIFVLIPSRISCTLGKVWIK